MAEELLSDLGEATQAVFRKAANAGLDYAVDWGSAFLAGWTIDSGSWSITPAGPGELRAPETLRTPTRTGATFTGGRPGVTYEIVNVVKLTDGRTGRRQLQILVTR